VEEQRKARLLRSVERFAATTAEPLDPARFDGAFVGARERVILPVFREVEVALRARGFAPRVLLDEAEERPSAELALGVGGEGPVDRVGFAVIRRRRHAEVLSYLVVSPPPMDLRRYGHPSELNADHVEQLVVDAIDHILSCRAATPRKR
jgi:hypothetical protein